MRHIDQVAVLPEYSSAGIGSEIILAAVGEAHRAGLAATAWVVDRARGFVMTKPFARGG